MRSTKLDMGKKRSNPERNKVEILATSDWLDRVAQEAERIGLNMSAYIRMVVTQRMDADEAARRETEEKKGGRK